MTVPGAGGRLRLAKRVRHVAVGRTRYVAGP
jgi:hypothetical protein